MNKTIKLRPKGLFAIITDAAFQDAKIEPFEQEILNKISKFLKLDKAVAVAIAKRSSQRYTEGKLGEEVPLCPKIVYRYALEVACADKTIDRTEDILLTALRKLFNISLEYHDNILDRIEKALLKQSEKHLPDQQSKEHVAEQQPKELEQLEFIGDDQESGEDNRQPNEQADEQPNEQADEQPDEQADERIEDYLPPKKSDIDNRKLLNEEPSESLLPSQVKDNLASKAAEILDGFEF